MRWIVVAAALLAPQESSPVPALLKKIDGRDLVDTFRAIDALADLGQERRAEIEKGAASLPEFYREALLAELKTSAPAPRITMETKKSKPLYHLVEWGRQVGIRIQNNENEDFGSISEIAFDRVHAMEAFARICEQGRLHTRQDPRDGTYIFGPREFTRAAFGHRSAAVVLYDGWTTRRVDFSGSRPWRLTLNFETVLGPGVRPVEWDRIRLFEAMGNDGTSLKSAEAEAPPIFLASDKYVNRWDPKLDISLLVPDSVSRIDRLRFSASGLVSSKERVVEFPGRAGRAERAGLEIEVGAIESEYASIRTLTVKMRTKDVALRRLLPALFNAGMEYKGVSAFTGIRDIQEIEGGVACIVEWYFSLEQMRKGPCRCVGCCSCLHFTDEEIEAAVPQGHPDRLWFNLPDGLEERTVYAEFRDIPLR